jgi:poly(3-hydroxybutyrate) depolymerase
MYKYEFFNPLYTMLEIGRFNISPFRIYLNSMIGYLESPYDPLYNTPLAQTMRAAIEMTERLTRDYEKPEFDIQEVVIGEKTHKITQETVISKSFCNLVHFKKAVPTKQKQPKLLIVAPMAGHHATLLRGTVQSMLPRCNVYITDWIDASQVPVSDGSFDMDDYINYVIEFLQFLGSDTHVLAVCQPTVPVLAAVALMSEAQDKAVPLSMIMMGGPVDARKSPTAVNNFATDKSIDWFKEFVITSVPMNHPGFTRKVYPGFLQLAGFISMNWRRHLDSHVELFKHLLEEDDAEADDTKEFYDEYLSVMDLPAEFYLQTIKEVFHDFSLAKHKLISRGRHVDTTKITKTAILGIEGEYDDISGRGQTKAVLDLCPNVSDQKKQYYLQKGVGHYGVFSGSKFRNEIAPVIIEFLEKWDK